MSTREVMAARRATADAVAEAASHAVRTEERYVRLLEQDGLDGPESEATALWRRAHVRGQLLLAEALEDAAAARETRRGASLAVFSMRGWASTIRRGAARYGALASVVRDELAEERALRGTAVAG